MKHVKLFSDSHYPIGRVDDKVFSSFTEHLGRCIYSGLYEPGHETADENGFRGDVMEMIKGLKVPVIRYPGGNFVSCYDWHDGIGPKEKRPKRLDYAWSSIETNEFGIDEFCRWAEKAGIEPMIAVNLGTGNIKDAGDLVEYCNFPGGTYWSDLRIANGHKEPYNVKYWCLGNEMEGSWQAGHLSAEDYTKKALEAAKIMHWVDPTIKLIACGSSYEMLPTYLEWDRVMLKDLFDQVDYLSTHNYTMNAGQSTRDYLSSYQQLDNHIKNSKKVIDYVKAQGKFQKDIKICLDEWNVWNFQDIKIESLSDLGGITSFEMTSAEKWEIAPPILEEKYSLLDALTFGGLGIALINNADTVEIACLAQLINVIAPITTKRGGGILKQSTYYPFELLSRYGRGTAMRTVPEGDTYDSAYGKGLSSAPCALIHNESTGEITVFALNIEEEELELSLELNGYGEKSICLHTVLSGENLSAINTFEAPDKVVPKELTASGTKAVLPKQSFNVIVMK